MMSQEWWYSSSVGTEALHILNDREVHYAKNWAVKLDVIPKPTPTLSIIIFTWRCAIVRMC